jgi:hypothetical protein
MILDSKRRSIYGNRGALCLANFYAEEGLRQLSEHFEDSFRLHPRIVDPSGRPAYGDGNTVPRIGSTINVKKPQRFMVQA